MISFAISEYTRKKVIREQNNHPHFMTEINTLTHLPTPSNTSNTLDHLLLNLHTLIFPYLLTHISSCTYSIDPWNSFVFWEAARATCPLIPSNPPSCPLTYLLTWSLTYPLTH